MTPVDNELIHKATSGDENSFQMLVYRYDRQVLSIALKYVRNEDDAKDIYQEVFIRVYRNLKKFQFKSEFSTWLFRITTNVCLTHKTRAKKRTFVAISEQVEDEETYSETLIDDEYTPDRYTASKEIGEQINEALEQLPPKQKMVFILKNQEGYKLREIAEIMDCKIGTVKKYLFEAVHKLRVELKEYYEYQ